MLFENLFKHEVIGNIIKNNTHNDIDITTIFLFNFIFIIKYLFITKKSSNIAIISNGKNISSLDILCKLNKQKTIEITLIINNI